MESTIFQSPERTKKMGGVERAISAIAGGTMLGFGLFAPGKRRIVIALAGSALLARGVTGYSLLYRMLNIYRAKDRFASGIRVERAVTIGRPVEEVYAFWRSLENLPRFMKNIQSVTERDGRSHWVAEAPLGATVEWDAVIEEDQPNARIAWRSIPGSQIENAGVVLFHPAPGERGTELRVNLEYKAPGGSLGAALARILGAEPDVQVREDLRRVKMLLETGQIISVSGQPSGRGRQQVAW
jgi:uncharacterized membrane protein